MGAAFLRPGAQDFRATTRPHVPQSGGPAAVHQWGQIHLSRHQRRWLSGASGVLPLVLVAPEDPDAIKMVGAVVDGLAAGVDSHLVDQLPARWEGLDGRRDTHSVGGEGLQDPAGDPAGELRTVIVARPERLADLPVTGEFVQVKRGTRTGRRVGNPTAGRPTSQRKMWSRLAPGREHSGQALLTATGAASMMVRFPASAAPVIVRPARIQNTQLGDQI